MFVIVKLFQREYIFIGLNFLFLTGLRQTMLFSATKDHRTDGLTQLFLKEKLLEIDVQSNRDEVTADGLEQGLIFIYYMSFFPF